MSDNEVYIQGDVCLIRIRPDIPEEWPLLFGFGKKVKIAQPTRGRVKIASGESGNVHVLAGQADWLEMCLEEINGLTKTTILVGERGAQLHHLPETEEAKKDTHHAPIDLPTGVYLLQMQREYVPQRPPMPVMD